MSRFDAWMTPQRLLGVSVGVALVTIALKTWAWYSTDSVGLLADAMESGVNLASAVFGLVMVTVAARPPDDEHPYGHGKAEYFSSGFEGLLIVMAALAMAYAAAQRWRAPQPLTQVGFGLGLSVASSALNAALAWAMRIAAKRHRSRALDADARHLMTDVWTTAGVIAGIALVQASGWLWLDAAVALAVALNILKEGVHLVWQSSQGLMDEAAEPEVQAHIQAVLQAHVASANAQGQTIRFDHVSTRQAGQRRFADLHMHAPADWTLGRAAAWRLQVEQALVAAVPGLKATIELLPSDAESHAQSHTLRQPNSAQPAKGAT